jgi:hypothetical protein
MTPWGWVRRPLLALTLGLCVASAGCSGSHPKATQSRSTPGITPVRTSASASASPSTSPSPPPVPSDSERSADPSQPPVVWIGGTLVEVAADSITVRESFGSVVELQRLGRGATTFFEISGGAWAEVPDGTSVEAGQAACVETLLNGPTLLALRVFLGASCGPA